MIDLNALVSNSMLPVLPHLIEIGVFDVAGSAEKLLIAAISTKSESVVDFLFRSPLRDQLRSSQLSLQRVCQIGTPHSPSPSLLIRMILK